MNAILHLPKTDVMRLALEKRVAEVHAGYVVQYVRGLACPEEQKKILLDAVKSSVCDKTASSR